MVCLIKLNFNKKIKKLEYEEGFQLLFFKNYENGANFYKILEILIFNLKETVSIISSKPSCKNANPDSQQ